MNSMVSLWTYFALFDSFIFGLIGLLFVYLIFLCAFLVLVLLLFCFCLFLRERKKSWVGREVRGS